MRGKRSTTESAGPSTTSVKCYQCGSYVERSGWCPGCNRFPSNITPRRTCEAEHVVAPDGWCHGCKDFLLTQLVYSPGGWRDTREVQRLLEPAVFHAKVSDLVVSLSAGKEMPKVLPRRSTKAERDAMIREWKIVKERMQQHEKQEATKRKAEEPNQKATEEMVPF